MPDHERDVMEPPVKDLMGHTALAETGLDAESLDRIATIELNAGGQCVGTLVEFIGIEKHAPIKVGVVEAIKKATVEGTDAVQAVETSLGMFIRRDEQGEVVRATKASKKK